DRARCAHVGDLRLERPFAVEHLNALVASIRDVEVAVRVGRQPADAVELALTGSGLAPGLHEVPVLAELRDAVVRPEAVGDVDVACAIPRDVRRTIERVAV